MTLQHKIKNFKFEDGLTKLEDIVAKLESGNLSLDDSLKYFEEGIVLSRLCSKKLNEVETKIEILIKNEEGNLIVQSFDEGKNDSKENIIEENKNKQETLF